MEIPARKPRDSKTRVPIMEGWKLNTVKPPKKKKVRQNDSLGSPSKLY